MDEDKKTALDYGKCNECLSILCSNCGKCCKCGECDCEKCHPKESDNEPDVKEVPVNYS
ncbi:MAG: hypothetical protein PF542_02085 [Nanoarchaeota archaeon]|jgi:hypothetical protein|nr:hypothetical protein [Nanoarchaeota archaeon]